MARVHVQIAIETEERSDRWACRSPEFGFTVYGKTREEARQEVNKALAALLNSFHGDLAAIERFLNQRGVRYYDIQAEHLNPSAATACPEPQVANGIGSQDRRTSTEVALEEVVLA